MVKDNGDEVIGFDSRAGQIGHTVTNSSLPLRRFFGAARPNAQALRRRDGPRHSHTLRRNTASILKM